MQQGTPATSTARTIDGRAVAAQLRDEVTARAAAFTAAARRAPGLATLLVGEDPASAVYVAAKQRACAEAGIAGFDRRLPLAATQEEVARVIAELGADDAVDGILLQLPLPRQLDALALTSAIHPDKDVDGLTPVSAGRLAIGLPGLRPCTPLGAMRLLAVAGVELAGKHAVVIGRSNLFGKPMALSLVEADATVMICHSLTRDLPAICRDADVIVAAAGAPRLVRADWIKPGAVVIDVGITRTGDGLVGDVDFDAVRDVAGAITPVPGGVGPMTIACLLSNTLDAAERRTAGAQSSR